MLSLIGWQNEFEGATCATPATKKRAGDAPGAALATLNKAAPKVINRRRTSGDPDEGAPSAASATRNAPEGSPCGAPAKQNEPDMLQVLRLSRINEYKRRGSTRRPE